MSLVKLGLKKSGSLRQRSKSRGRASVRRRPGGYRPELLALEARLPPGDAFLGLLAGSWLLASSRTPPAARSPAGEFSAGNSVVQPAPTPGSSGREGRLRGEATALTSAFSLFVGDLFEASLSDFTGAFAGQAPMPFRESVNHVWPDEAFPSFPETAPRAIVASVSSQIGSAARGESSSGVGSERPGMQGITTSTPLRTTAAAAPDAALLATVARGETRPGAGPAGPKQPNFVFILTDDQDAASMQYLPRVQELLGRQGATFENMFVNNPLCCPSHVSILTGQYSHNHQILHVVPPLGGFQKFVDMRTDGDPSTLGDETTLATWLQDAGYLTGRAGKYLVGYPEDSTYIPPGWDDWFSTYGGGPGYYNYGVNDNGRVLHFGDRPEDYSTDVLTSHVISFLDRAEQNDAQPFFAFFAPSAPHAQGRPNGAPIPALRHLGMFDGATAPRPASFNEADVSDKPPHIRDLPLLTPAQIAAIDRQYQARLESLQAVDEGVEQIVDALVARGELENTYLIFTSDNGYHLGQHRLFEGKNEAYEEDIRVPLLVRGPGVRAGVTLDHMALNIDFAPTITELAGAPAGREMDGRSLVPLFARDTPLNHWRHDFLVEIYRNPPMEPGAPGFALRTRRELYMEYADGFRELYDLRRDPYQLENVIDTAGQGHVRRLSRHLAEQVSCAGDTCRE